MSSGASKESGHSVRPERSKWIGTFLTAIVILLWLQLFLALTFTWSNGKYYHYGWIVPLLVAFCFWRQWQNGVVSGGTRADIRTPGRSLLIGAGAMLLVVTLLRILELSDPGWRVPLWSHALLLTVYSSWLLIVVIGVRRAGAFVFIGLLALTAVPLPSMLEMGLVGRLSQWVVDAAGSLLSLLGNATEIRGNMLIVDGKQLEVDQACSGIRSFQSLFMYALFFGEFWRLNILGRVSLLAVGLVLAIVTNVARVIVLTKVFITGGQEGFDSAHDWVGYLAFLVATAGLLLAGKFLDGSGRNPSDQAV